MTLFSISAAERRLALQLLDWEEHPDYAFAWKSDSVLLVSRSKAEGGEVFEVDLEAKATRRVGGSGEYRLPDAGSPASG